MTRRSHVRFYKIKIKKQPDIKLRGYNRDKLRIFLWKKMDNLNIKTKYGKLNYEHALINLLNFMLAQPFFPHRRLDK